MKMNRSVALIVLVLALSAGVALAADITINIVAAPNVVSLDSQGTIFTVHTDIPFGDVVAANVTLNGIAIDWWKMDNRGNFVAKFALDAVKALEYLVPGPYELKLEGVTTTGETFWGTDTITVVAPTGKSQVSGVKTRGPKSWRDR